MSAFLLAASGIALFTGISLLSPGFAWRWLWALNPRAYQAFGQAPRPWGILLLVLAVLAVSAGVGLLRGRKWAWWVALSIFAVNGVGDFVSFLATGDWIRAGAGALVGAAFLLVLARPDVRRSLN